MKIFVKVKPDSNKEEVNKISENIFEVNVKEKARQGRANQALVVLLKEYFNAKDIRILKGHKQKKKLVKVNK